MVHLCARPAFERIAWLYRDDHTAFILYEIWRNHFIGCSWYIHEAISIAERLQGRTEMNTVTISKN